MFCGLYNKIDITIDPLQRIGFFLETRFLRQFPADIYKVIKRLLREIFFAVEIIKKTSLCETGFLTDLVDSRC